MSGAMIASLGQPPVEFACVEKGIQLISGPTLGDPEMRATAHKACRALQRQGVAISVDPNIRGELMCDTGYIDGPRALVRLADDVLPPDEDARMLSPRQACAGWAATSQNARAVALKTRALGCSGDAGGGSPALPADPDGVIDPTGAGGCFFVPLVTPVTMGANLPDALRAANAAKASAVSIFGPMEDNAGLPAIESSLRKG